MISGGNVIREIGGVRYECSQEPQTHDDISMYCVETGPTGGSAGGGQGGFATQRPQQGGMSQMGVPQMPSTIAISSDAKTVWEKFQKAGLEKAYCGAVGIPEAQCTMEMFLSNVASQLIPADIQLANDLAIVKGDCGWYWCSDKEYDAAARDLVQNAAVMERVMNLRLSCFVIGALDAASENRWNLSHDHVSTAIAIRHSAPMTLVLGKQCGDIIQSTQREMERASGQKGRGLRGLQPGVGRLGGGERRGPSQSSTFGEDFGPAPRSQGRRRVPDSFGEDPFGASTGGSRQPVAPSGGENPF